MASEARVIAEEAHASELPALEATALAVASRAALASGDVARALADAEGAIALRDELGTMEEDEAQVFLAEELSWLDLVAYVIDACDRPPTSWRATMTVARPGAWILSSTPSSRAVGTSWSSTATAHATPATSPPPFKRARRRLPSRSGSGGTPNQPSRHART